MDVVVDSIVIDVPESGGRNEETEGFVDVSPDATPVHSHAVLQAWLEDEGGDVDAAKLELKSLRRATACSNQIESSLQARWDEDEEKVTMRAKAPTSHDHARRRPQTEIFCTTTVCDVAMQIVSSTCAQACVKRRCQDVVCVHRGAFDAWIWQQACIANAGDEAALPAWLTGRANCPSTGAVRARASCTRKGGTAEDHVELEDGNVHGSQERTRHCRKADPLDDVRARELKAKRGTACFRFDADVLQPLEWEGGFHTRLTRVQDHDDAVLALAPWKRDQMRRGATCQCRASRHGFLGAAAAAAVVLLALLLCQCKASCEVQRSQGHFGRRPVPRLRQVAEPRRRQGQPRPAGCSEHLTC